MRSPGKTIIQKKRRCYYVEQCIAHGKTCERPRTALYDLKQGFMLKRKINAGQIFSVSGVCVSLAPKMLRRYKRIELVDTATGDDVHFILPKKVVFKVGHVYNCYFDHPIGNRPVSINKPPGGFTSADLDLPTNGFLGSEDFGVYHEKPAVEKTSDIKEENNHEASNNNETTHTDD